MALDLAPFGRWTLREKPRKAGYPHVERQLSSKLNGNIGSVVVVHRVWGKR